MIDIIMETIAAYPLTPAIDDGTTILSYAELGTSIRDLTKELWASDVGPGTEWVSGSPRDPKICMWRFWVS